MCSLLVYRLSSTTAKHIKYMNLQVPHSFKCFIQEWPPDSFTYIHLQLMLIGHSLIDQKAWKVIYALGTCIHGHASMVGFVPSTEVVEQPNPKLPDSILAVWDWCHHSITPVLVVMAYCGRWRHFMAPCGMLLLPVLCLIGLGPESFCSLCSFTFISSW